MTFRINIRERKLIDESKNYCVSSRRYRNRHIGDFLKELHLTEGRNTGFKKILDALDTNNSPKPEFETDDNHSYFITRLYVHEAFLEEKAEGNKSLSGLLSEVLLKKDFDKTEKIINFMDGKGKITPKEAEKICGKSAATVRRYLKMLVEVGYVEAEGGNK